MYYNVPPRLPTTDKNEGGGWQDYSLKQEVFPPTVALLPCTFSTPVLKVNICFFALSPAI